MEHKDSGLELYEVGYLWNCKDEEIWLNALNKYWEKFSFEQMKLEQKINNIQFRILKKYSVEEFYDFLYNEFFVWKYTAKNRLATTRKSLEKYVKENRMSELEEIMNNIFESDFCDITESMKTVMKIYGLGTSGATAFLAIILPEKFGTVDQFVVKSLLKINGLNERNVLCQMNPENLRISDVVTVIHIMKNKAQELNKCFETDFWTPRKIDMILWAIGR